MYNGRNTCEIFSDFGQTFDNMLIVSFLPFLESALENTVEILQADNVQSVELRIVMGTLYDENNKLLSFEEEMKIYDEIHQKIKKKYNFDMIYIWTVIKALGKEAIINQLKVF